jgi:hypothetical protein
MHSHFMWCLAQERAAELRRHAAQSNRSRDTGATRRLWRRRLRRAGTAPSPSPAITPARSAE